MAGTVTIAFDNSQADLERLVELTFRCQGFGQLQLQVQIFGGFLRRLPRLADSTDSLAEEVISS